jgi:hypothetical protein
MLWCWQWSAIEQPSLQLLRTFGKLVAVAGSSFCLYKPNGGEVLVA